MCSGSGEFIGAHPSGESRSASSPMCSWIGTPVFTNRTREDGVTTGRIHSHEHHVADPDWHRIRNDSERSRGRYKCGALASREAAVAGSNARSEPREVRGGKAHAVHMLWRDGAPGCLYRRLPSL